MAKKKIVKTNAIRLVEQKKISYQEYTYDWQENHLGADEVAAKLGQNPAQVFKTLVGIKQGLLSLSFPVIMNWI